MIKSHKSKIFLFFIFMVIVQTDLSSQVDNNKNLQQFIVKNGMSLLDQPYKASTLESDGPEKLIYSTDAFDCVTFVEFVLALSIYQTNNSQGNFEAVLQQLRYRDGIINGYGSRLHYFTEWILQNCEQKLCSNVTTSIGGKPYHKSINFISTNKNKYPKLKDKAAFQDVLSSEKKLNKQTWSYIPKNLVSKVEPQIQDGDIIAITTDIAGLDIVHVGFAKWNNNMLCLLHASEKEKKIVLTTQSLSEYLIPNKNQSGIMVIRCHL